jgi:hypothetical protein
MWAVRVAEINDLIEFWTDELNRWNTRRYPTKPSLKKVATSPEAYQCQCRIWTLKRERQHATERLQSLKAEIGRKLGLLTSEIRVLIGE